MGSRLADIVCKSPRLNKRVQIKWKMPKNNKGNKRGNNRRSSVYTVHKQMWVCVWERARRGGEGEGEGEGRGRGERARGEGKGSSGLRGSP